MTLVPMTFSVMKMYQLYRDGKLIVNRTYQRKLVWSLEEKKSLIDSILKDFPVPLILLAEWEEKYEIIDGIQRLNAIFGFIENEFPLDGPDGDIYFNTQLFVSAKTVAEMGIFNPIEGENIKYLDNKNSSSFLEYQMPTTIFSAGEDRINETFKRINSNGKHLSPQEIRQAGAISKLSNLVRELGAEFRGDVSKDIVLLSEMPKISVDAKGSKFGYGILAEETFWCKNGILNTPLLRESEDEQFIADLVLSIALKEPFPASKERFDSYYGKSSQDRSSEIESALNGYGVENIKADIKYVFSKIKDITEIKLNDQKKLKQILNPSTSRNPSKEPFYTLFMAMYELIILEKREPFDLDSFFEAIYDLSAKTKSGSHYVRSADRRKNINLCKGLIRDSFKESTAPIRSQGKLALDFENYLRLSKVESPCYDFKQGLYSLDKINRGMKKEMLDKYFSNIAALANLGKNKKGYMFIGVTDKEKDTKIIEEIDSLKGIPRFDKFGVVGLEREAKLKGISLDEYILLIAQKIRDSELPSWLKSKINTNMTPITYRGFTVLMLEIESGTQPVWYKNKLFIRDGASHKEVTGEETNSVYNLFN